jgi:dihydrofolate reductase
MGKLRYTAIASLDGYVADRQGNFDWAAPDEEVHAFVNDLERETGTYLYGRRIYEVMTYWETAPSGSSPVGDDYAQVWQSADKVVYSTTLEAVGTRRTRLERHFEPDVVRRWVAESDRDVSVGGADLAGQALAAGIVDEVGLFLTPVVVGSGTRALPDNVFTRLTLVDERRFAGGTVFLRYRI